MHHIRIVTKKPVAFDSPDHIQPWGTARDNSVNFQFNRKLFWWIPAPRLSVLDLGCAGGGFVQSILERGGFAVGVEGSDYSRLRRRAAWQAIPDHLFTADITEPFQLVLVGNDQCELPLRFNVITAWEVIEHIHKDQLGAVAQNISRHLMPHGVLIMSISPNEEVINGVRLHRTVEPRDWWISAFSRLGLRHHPALVRYFGDDWIRGEGNAPGSFHLVMARTSEPLLSPNRLRTVRALALQYDFGRKAWRMFRHSAERAIRLLPRSPGGRG